MTIDTVRGQNKPEFIVHHWDYVNCPFCDGNNSKPHEKFGPDHRYSYVQCKECALVYLNPRPHYDESFVETAYGDYCDGSHYMSHKGELSDSQKKQIEEYSIILKKIIPFLPKRDGKKLKMLEIGCADGMFLMAASQLNFEVIGIDITKKGIDSINNFLKLKAYCQQYQDADLSKEGPFDLIYCSHVIEHIPNVNVWMEKYKSDLADDGILCINVPNQFAVDKIFKRFLKNIGLKKDKWALWRTPDHLYEPHGKPMKYLFSKHDFKLIENYTYSKREKIKNSLGTKIYHSWFKLAAKERFILKKVKS